MGAQSHETTQASLRSHILCFAQVATATSLVAVLPIVVVWWLRVSGVLTSYLPGMAIGVALSLIAAHLGRLFWQTRPGSQNLLFSELLVWGFLHRRYTDRRIASARALLGRMSEAQRNKEGGISAARQAKLLERLAAAMDASDPHTNGHSRRVARYAWMIATRRGLSREQVARIRAAAAIHDIGKIETPRGILRKPGALSDAEYEIVKRHAATGAEMAAVLHDEELTSIIRHHHERLDGTGYPDGLAGEEIPLGARIIAVADTFDSITANRPYRAAMSHKVALDILRKEAGTQLDPDVVRAFCAYYSGRRPLTLWAWLTSLPSRAVSELGSGVASVASAAKVVAVAALVGSAAAGTASLTHPVAPHRAATIKLATPIDVAQGGLPGLILPVAAVGSGTAGAPAGSGSHQREAGRRGAARTPGGRSPAGAQPAPSGGAGAAGTQAGGEGASTTAGEGTSGGGGEGKSGGGSEGKGEGSSGGGGEGSSGGGGEGKSGGGGKSEGKGEGSSGGGGEGKSGGGKSEGKGEGKPVGGGKPEGTPEGKPVSGGKPEGTPEGKPVGSGAPEGTPEGKPVSGGKPEGAGGAKPVSGGAAPEGSAKGHGAPAEPPAKAK